MYQRPKPPKWQKRPITGPTCPKHPGASLPRKACDVERKQEQMSPPIISRIRTSILRKTFKTRDGKKKLTRETMVRFVTEVPGVVSDDERQFYRNFVYNNRTHQQLIEQRGLGGEIGLYEYIQSIEERIHLWVLT